MLDQIIDAVAAQERQAFAIQSRRLWGWIIMQDQPDYPGKVTGRLCIEAPTPYVLVANTLGEIQAKLPAGLVRFDRQPADPRGVVNFGFRRSAGGRFTVGMLACRAYPPILLGLFLASEKERP